MDSKIIFFFLEFIPSNHLRLSKLLLNSTSRLVDGWEVLLQSLVELCLFLLDFKVANNELPGEFIFSIVVVYFISFLNLILLVL